MDVLNDWKETYKSSTLGVAIVLPPPEGQLRREKEKSERRDENAYNMASLSLATCREVLCERSMMLVGFFVKLPQVLRGAGDEYGRSPRGPRMREILLLSLTIKHSNIANWSRPDKNAASNPCGDLCLGYVLSHEFESQIMRGVSR